LYRRRYWKTAGVERLDRDGEKRIFAMCIALSSPKANDVSASSFRVVGDGKWRQCIAQLLCALSGTARGHFVQGQPVLQG